jgi:import receptor subunit TOM70
MSASTSIAGAAATTANAVAASSSSSSSSAVSIVEKVQDFVSENKRAVLLGGALVVALAGIGYVSYQRSSAAAAGRGGDDSDVEAGERGEERKGKKKKSKGKKKRLTGNGDGPILEEIKPAPSVAASVEDAGADSDSGVPLSSNEIDTMSTEERQAKAMTFKTKGNSAYQQRQFVKAVDYYTRAIEVAATADPIFYSNRAASYINFSPPRYDLVVEDCDAALKLDPTYVKALNRRAIALENLDRFEEALRDFTAATILDKFQNETAAQAVERVLRRIATSKAVETLASREKRLPSFTFISAYLAAFRPRPILTLPETPSTGDETLLLAFQALQATDYAHAVTLVNEAIDQGITESWSQGRAEALNLRGTFKFLVGDSAGAKDDFEASISILPSLTQSWVKIASVHMEQGNPELAFDAFEQAIGHNAQDPDIYYHRGQVHFILGDFAKAAEDYSQSSSLDESFVFSHIQLAVAQYKAENVANSMATFRRTLKAFPERSEPQNYYGELLLDQQRFQDAVDKFDRAIELEKAKPPPMNVLPLVNKGLALYQWKQDLAAAEELCQEALSIDSECEAAVATLAQLSLQQGKIESAVEMFGKHAGLARTEPELVNALTYEYASKAQLEFIRNYPEMTAQLGSLARSMMG